VLARPATCLPSVRVHRRPSPVVTTRTSASRLAQFPCNAFLVPSLGRMLCSDLCVSVMSVLSGSCCSQACDRLPCAMTPVASALLVHGLQPFTARATCLISELPSTTSPATTYRLISRLPLSRPLLTHTLCLHRLIDPITCLSAVEVRSSAVLFGLLLLYL